VSRPRTALATRLCDELPELDRAVREAIDEWRRAELTTHDHDVFIKAVALDLQSFYRGAETLFELIAREVDDMLPIGESWHMELLQQMGAPVPGRRPAVVGRDTLRDLDEIRGFRHRVRNIYASNLDAAKMKDMVASLPLLWPRLMAEISVFADFLRSSP
jgi:hypothetical protein